jgi:hypothetical protein
MPQLSQGWQKKQVVKNVLERSPLEETLGAFFFIDQTEENGYF